MANKGVVIYAFKKPAYGKLAWNLAASIKAVSPNIPVAVITDEDGVKDKGALSHLEQWRLDYFSHIIVMSNDDLYDNGKFSPGKGKISGYKYFPFERNMIIDADSICIEPIEPLFDKCTKDIHSQVVGVFPYSNEKWTCQWMSLPDVKDTFDVDSKSTFYEINSSFFYAKKGEVAEQLYTQAMANYELAKGNDKVRKWGGTFPDELAFNVAFAQCGVNPLFDGQDETISTNDSIPILFGTQFNNDWSFAHKIYNFITLYGDASFSAKKLQEYYDRLMVGVGRKLSFQHIFKISSLMKEKHVLSK